MSLASTAPRFRLDVTKPIRSGMLYVVVGLLGFLLWAALAPLTSAAVAPGIVVADSRNKTIQHLEGGIISEILVHEGDQVSAGQVLARLNSASTDASLGRVRSARIAALAEEARLIAERDDTDSIAFPAELTGRETGTEALDAIKSQSSLFESHRTTRTSEEGIIDQRIAQSEEEIRGIEAQIASEDTQITLIGDEIADIQILVKKGLERKPRLRALERSAADLEGQRGQHSAEIARARQTIAEMQEHRVNQRSRHIDEVDSQLHDVRLKLADLAQQMIAASDASRRLEVKAPVSGKIVSIFHETPGGVLKPGETIMELLPDQDQLVIEAQVRPEDINAVLPDQKVRVRLTAYSQRRTPSLEGRVTELSPDRINDDRGRKAHYLARITVSATELAARQDLKLYPGMPAVAYIETGQESLLSYLLTPLFNGIERGLREQ
jgi:membrane fusion protein, type I secretion system